MRDPHAPPEYFASTISELESIIAAEEQRASSAPEDRLDRVYFGSWRAGYDILRAEYSRGLPASEFLERVPGLVEAAAGLDFFSFGVLANGVRRHFEQFVALSSWAVLLGDVEVKETLASIYERDDGRDFLLASFLELDEVPDFLYLESLRVELKQAAALALEGRGEEAAVVLTKFVKSQWYNRNQGAAWHGTHRKLRSYLGYWCWEAAAVAKCFGIDDSALEGHKYYPWDLAHPDESSAL